MDIFQYFFNAGVIDLFGSAGGLMAFRAALLASHGFTTYALPYFSYDDLPIDANNIEIEYFEEAIEWFLKHPNVKSDGVATIATSFGVSPALLLATNTKNKIKASVCEFLIFVTLQRDSFSH